ncbi:MAG: Ltp family lipoprotein [Brevibacterium aurantiacum]
MSQAGIHDPLTSEDGDQFTQEQADYAVANLDG